MRSIAPFFSFFARYSAFMFVLPALSLMTGVTYGADPSVPSVTEAQSLPPYCAARMFNKPGSPSYDTWAMRLGPGFLHVHHYCWALNFERRSYVAKTLHDKKELLGQAIANYDYVKDHAEENFVLMADVYLGRGKAYVLLEDFGKAFSDFQKAISLNPKLVQAYVAYADSLLKSPRENRQTESLGIVTEGLRHIPKSKALQRRFLKLGGVQPFPDPYVLESVNVGGEAMPENQGSSTAGVVAPLSDDTTQISAEKKESEELAPSENRNLKNPWCRFCPDSDSESNPISESKK